ncbi:box C/D snoRNA protein 1 isoform X1 [Chelonia mydas]|uniref:box C/D snoRNA protein 1 isoform X1 n=2 Tax=Chelonia mydas TaxID=8469 RepID=UPI001CA891D0|nr:box C/D snoRNA protein 1 isoform X1 [Chelonia mydas]
METAELSQAAARGRSPAAIPQRSRKAPPLVRNAAHVGPGGVWAAGTRMEEEGAEVASGPAGSPEGPGTETGSPGLACGKRKMALHRCETCSGEEAKYRCPRCMKYSCSLACVKKHKTALSCNGIREKAAFVSINEFSELNLLSDYRFLEDVGRMTDGAARDVFLHRPTTNKFINYLKNRARKHNIHLKTLPIGFTKRRENSTTFNKKEQRFYWHLKLIFPHSHAEYTVKRVPDDKTLGEILKPYLDPEESDPVIRQRLKIYTMSPQSDVQILMKIENRQHNSVSYDELHTSKSLLDNLKDKVVIEYPTLLVVLKKLKNDMRVLGQDASESTEDLDSDSSSLSSEEEGEIRDSS